MNPTEPFESTKVYCPMCTHTVEARIERHLIKGARRPVVVPGQKCRQCSASLDAGYILPRVSAGVRAA